MWWLIPVSFVLALLLTTVPFPDWAIAWRPAWVTMVLVYWCINLPERIGVTAGWVAGILLDVLTGSLLGQHALGLGVVAFVTVKSNRTMRVSPLVHQSLFIGLMVLVHLLLMLFVKGMVGLPPRDWTYVAPVLTSILLWPLLFLLLRDYRGNTRLFY